MRCMQCPEPAEVRMKDRALFGMRVRNLCAKHVMEAIWINLGTHKGFWRAKRGMELEALNDD